MLSWPEQARLAQPTSPQSRSSLNGNCLAPSLLPRVEKTPKLGESKDGSSEFMKTKDRFREPEANLESQLRIPPSLERRSDSS